MVNQPNAIERLKERRYICPEHRMPDCSPLLNGCSIPNQFFEDVAAVDALYQAAAPLGDYDLNAATWPVGGQEWRGIRDIDLQSLVRRLEALAAAVSGIEEAEA